MNTLILCSGLFFAGLTVFLLPASAQQVYSSWYIANSVMTEGTNALKVSDTSFIVLAQTSKTWPAGNDARCLVACYTIDGRTLWQTELASRFSMNPTRIFSIPGGWKIIAMGADSDTLTANFSPWVGILDSTGTLVQETDLLGYTSPEISLVTIFDNGNYVLANLNARNTTLDIYLYTGSDSLQWHRTIEFEHQTYFYGIAHSKESIFISGRAMPTDAGWNNTVVYRISTSGNLLWSQTYHSPVHEYNTGMIVLKDGTLAVHGFRKDSIADQTSDLAILHLTDNGDILATIVDSMFSVHNPINMVELTDGGLIVAANQNGLGKFARAKLVEKPRVDYVSGVEIATPNNLLNINNSVLIALQVKMERFRPPTPTRCRTQIVVFSLDGVSSVPEEFYGHPSEMDLW